MAIRNTLAVGLCAAICNVSLAAEPNCEANLLKNGDFEEGFANWRKPASMWRVEDGAGYESSKGLVWECDDAEKYVYPAQYLALEPGCAYRISALVKVDSLKGASRPSVAFEWFDANGKWTAGAYANTIDDNGMLKDGWKRYEVITRMMKSSDAKGAVLCLLEKGSTGKVRFDNVTCERVPIKAVTFICTSAFRDSASEGDLRVLASISASPDLHAAALTVKTASGSVRKLEPTVFSEDTAVFSVPVKELAMGRQKMSFTLTKRMDGTAVGAADVSFERTAEGTPHRRVSFDGQRRMLLDGKKFFPLGLYTGGMNDEELKLYKRGPYNFAIQYGNISAAMLDRWQKAGVVVATDVRSLIYGYNYSAKSKLATFEDSKAALRKKYEEVGRHPALVMWYLNDEAPVNFVPNTTKVHEFLHQLDPDRATITCLCQSGTVRDFMPSYDVIAHDCYPIGNLVGKSMLERVTRQMRDVESGLAGMRPVWFIPQAFDWRWYYKGEMLEKCDQPYLRMPTRQEIANMSWQGVACGANGIVIYAYSSMRSRLKGAEFEKAWGDTCDVAFEVKRMEDVLLADDISADFVKGCASLPKYLPVRFYMHDGKVWMLAVNATREPMRAKLDLGAKCRDLKTALGGGVALLPDGQTLNLDMPPQGYAFVSFMK